MEGDCRMTWLSGIKRPNFNEKCKIFPIDVWNFHYLYFKILFCTNQYDDRHNIILSFIPSRYIKMVSPVYLTCTAFFGVYYLVYFFEYLASGLKLHYTFMHQNKDYSAVWNCHQNKDLRHLKFRALCQSITNSLRKKYEHSENETCSKLSPLFKSISRTWWLDNIYVLYFIDIYFCVITIDTNVVLLNWKIK